MESVITNDKWRLTLHGNPASTLKPSSVDFHFSLKNSHQLQYQSISDVATDPQESPTWSVQVSHSMIEDPVSLEAEISKGLEYFGVNTSLWSDIICPILCFVDELMDYHGAASALAVDLELSVGNNKAAGEHAETCAICLDKLRTQVGLTRTPCDHEFHDPCLTSWLRLDNSCPLCWRRVSMDVNDDYDLFQIYEQLHSRFDDRLLG